jgi:hypothetical protein
LSGKTYRETVFSKFNAGIFVVVVGWLGYTMYRQITVGPVGTRPASNEFLAGMVLLFAAIGVLFSRLRIDISADGIKVGYGFIKHSIKWKDVIQCELDTTPALHYGGWGIRLARTGGKWRIVYSTVGEPRVMLSLAEGRFREIAFSSRKPEQVIRIVNDYIAARE